MTDTRMYPTRREFLAASAALATPAIARAQGTAKTGAVRIEVPTILSGPIALLGTSQRNAAQMAVDKIAEVRSRYLAM